MEYEVIYFSKYNMSAAKQAAGKAGADWLLFVQQGGVLTDDSPARLEKYVAMAGEKTVAFELHTEPVATGRHTDPVTLEIMWADPGAVLIKRSAFMQVGGFDTAFNLLAFIDLSWRLRSAGYTLQACPLAAVKVNEVPDERYEYIYDIVCSYLDEKIKTNLFFCIRLPNF